MVPIYFRRPLFFYFFWAFFKNWELTKKSKNIDLTKHRLREIEPKFDPSPCQPWLGSCAGRVNSPRNIGKSLQDFPGAVPVRKCGEMSQ